MRPLDISVKGKIKVKGSGQECPLYTSGKAEGGCPYMGGKDLWRNLEVLVACVRALRGGDDDGAGGCAGGDRRSDFCARD